MPDASLSLAARLCLLAWDTERMKLTGVSQLAHLVRAGALTELAQRGVLADDGGIARPVSDDRTGDPALDDLLELIEESRPRTWKSWVTSHSKYTLDAVQAQLAGTGHLRKEHGWGLFSRTQYRLERPDVVKVLRAEARDVLTGPVPVDQVSDRDAALVALAAAAELRTLATGGERRQYRERVEALTVRGGAAAPALKKVIDEVRTAVVVVTATTAATAGSG